MKKSDKEQNEIYTRDINQIIANIRDAEKAEIKTPTGKEWQVFYDKQFSEFKIFTQDGFERGESAKTRLKETLRRLGTDFNLIQKTE